MLTAEERKIVKKARRLITPADRWTRRQAAQNRDGCPVTVYVRAAYRFCAYGALWRAALSLGSESPAAVADCIASKLITAGPDALSTINDGPGGHRKVLAIFDKALTQKQSRRSFPQP
jgi:hypothetical protein